MTELSFVNAVAERCGRPRDEVTRVLSTFHIPTAVKAANPHRLRVTRLMFEGNKTGVPEPGPFQFERNFGDGIWAFVSERNEAGKSSVFEIIVWALRGVPRERGLQEDVHKWISRVELDGTIDGQAFHVAFSMTDGEPVGSVKFGTWQGEFTGDDEFADLMSTFMMDRLGLAPFQGWQSDVGRVTQGWNAYTTTLYFPRDAMPAVLGTTVQGGLASRLLLLFVGVPWSETYVACKTAERQVNETTTKQRAADDTVQRAASAALLEVEAEIAKVEARLAVMPDTTEAVSKLRTATAEYTALLTALSSSDRQLTDARSEARAAARTARQERKRAQDVNEARRVERLFHGMSPTVCPRCSTKIGDDRITKEKDHDKCSVCDRDLELEDVDEVIDDNDIDEDDEDVVDDNQDTLDARATAMEAAGAAAEERVNTLNGQLTEARRERDEAEGMMDRLHQDAAAGQERTAVELELVALRARAEQLRDLTATPIVLPLDGEDGADAALVVAAAAKEADQRVKTGFDSVVADLNAEILSLGQRFGIEALQSVSINRATHLHLQKGDAETGYGACTPGERLRLRLAVVIAMLRVADRHGVGRHPGLLMIDSLGAEETEASNLGQFAEALAEVTDELGIETIIASARDTSAGHDPILTHVPADHALVVTGNDPMW